MLTPPLPDRAGADAQHHVVAVDAAAQGAQAADGALARVGPGGFSQAAATEFKGRIDAYAADLAREAVRVAERHQADVVSPAYVRQASGYLVARTRDRKLAALGSLGAMLLGVALPALFEMPWTREVSTTRVLLSAVFGMAGSLLLALRFVRD